MKQYLEHYAKCHFKQIQSLYKKGYYSQLLMCAHSPPSFRIPSLIACKMFEDAAMESFQDEQQLNIPINLLWLIISSHMIGMDYEEFQEKLFAHGDKYKQIVQDWTKITKPLSHPPQVKSLLRNKYEQLLQKASNQNYYLMPRVPAFLVSTKWLQQFYSSQGNFIGGVSNFDLFEPVKYIDTDPKNLHLNYKLKDNLRENVDFKIISFEAWNFLRENFGGIEFRRFNTNEKQPTCQLYPKKIKIILTVGRYIVGNQSIQILGSRSDTVSDVIDRIKRLVIAYKLLSFDQLKNAKWQVLKIRNITQNQFIDILQDEQVQISKQYKKISAQAQIERIDNKYDLEQIQYFSETDSLIMNLNLLPTISNAIKFQQIPLKKSNKVKVECLTCKKSDDLKQCICRSAYFCNKQCKIRNKQHQQLCKELIKQESKLISLFQFYDVRKRTVDYDKVCNRGKVGLQNLGNTCFMSSALQCVLNLQFLNKYLMSNQHLQDINPTNVLGTQGHLVCVYGQFVKEYYTTSRRYLEPTKILRIIAKNPQFRGHNHQDSQQFLNYFLDKLHEDLNKIKNKPYIEDIQSNGRPDEIVSQESWDNYLKRNKSYISQYLAGQYRSQIRCPDCQRISITFDPYLSVTLFFPKIQKQLQVSGFYLSKYGQFRKVSGKVPSSTIAQKFTKQYFHTAVKCIHIKNKKPNKQWKMNKSVYHNDQNFGLVLFYELPSENPLVQLQTFFTNQNILPRKFYYNEKIADIDQLMVKLYITLKHPILKSLDDAQLLQMSDQEYLKEALQAKFITIANKDQLQFPLEGTNKIQMKIQWGQNCQSKLYSQKKIKFDVSAGRYEPKQQFKTRSIDDQLTISSMITSFSEPEQLTSQNAWYCNKCKDHKLAMKKMQIYKTPKYLIIHLKRFNHSGNRYVIYGQKVRTPVVVKPVQTINGKKYELLGFVNHFGNLNFGHYTATVKNADGWYDCDDSSIRKTKLDGNSAYILFYKQIDQEENN